MANDFNGTDKGFDIKAIRLAEENEAYLERLRKEAEDVPEPPKAEQPEGEVASPVATGGLRVDNERTDRAALQRKDNNI